MLPEEIPFSIYPYTPSKARPIIFATLILLLGISLFVQSVRYKWHHFNFMVTWGSLVWCGGFIARALSVYSPKNLYLYLSQYILIFVGPPMYAVSEYFILGRLLAYLPYHTPIHPGRVLSTFLFLGAAVETLAGAGAAITGSVTAKANVRATGISLIKASLILQEVVEVCFIAMVALVEYRCRRVENFPKNVRIMCRLLYVTSMMMTLRCIIRTLEGFEASSCKPGVLACGPVQKNEWYLWVFEVSNITLLVLALALFHPGRYLPADNKVYLDPTDGVTERLGPGYSQADQRPWLLTVIDPFDFGGMVSRNPSGVDRFWERENPVVHGGFAARKRKVVERSEMTGTVDENAI